MAVETEMLRPDRIDGREITIDCNGLLARCLQHECDHLNGILFVERVSSAQKITLRNKLKRLALGY
jgi:peptide deformylase